MPSRSELVVRASAVGLDPTTTGYFNDSKLEQRVLWLEKRATTFSGTKSSQVLTNNGTQSQSGDTVLIGTNTYTFVTALSEVSATSTLTSNGTEMSDGDWVSVGGYTYTFRTALTNGGTTPGEVLIDGSAANGLLRLGYAIANTGGTVGTDYGSGNTANPLVTVGTANSTALPLTASVSLTNATQGNQIQTTAVSVGSTLSWTGTFFSGGVNAVANQVLLGVSVATEMANLKNAINGGTGMGTTYSTGTAALPSVVATNNNTTVTVTATDYAIANGSIATTTPINTPAVNSWGNATLISGVKNQIAENTTTYEGANGLSGDAVVWD